jgi:hypothetical protein
MLDAARTVFVAVRVFLSLLPPVSSETTSVLPPDSTLPPDVSSETTSLLPPDSTLPPDEGRFGEDVVAAAPSLFVPLVTGVTFAARALVVGLLAEAEFDEPAAFSDPGEVLKEM